MIYLTLFGSYMGLVTALCVALGLVILLLVKSS